MCGLLCARGVRASVSGACVVRYGGAFSGTTSTLDLSIMSVPRCDVTRVATRGDGVTHPLYMI